MSPELLPEILASFRGMQTEITDALCQIDTGAKLVRDEWRREAEDHAIQADAGGGVSVVVSGGAVFEKAGVNFSEVRGILPKEMCHTLIGRAEALPFYATGTSLVIHPRSPMIPTVHANVRYLQVDEELWFGGGTDLTPYYLYREDARHFHSILSSACARHDPSFYPRFKQWCDEYFFLPHRAEARGIGGIFFDYLGRKPGLAAEVYWPFVQDIAKSFGSAYLPIVERRLNERWGERERDFQLHRRGRYVEFNLMYDRGTLFGLKSKGRTESILMSLPPEVRWSYGFTAEVGSREECLMQVLKHPCDWMHIPEQAEDFGSANGTL